jgi:hypothetical protein
VSTNLEILEELTTSLLKQPESHNLFKDALDLLPVGVAIISSRIVTWANKKTLQLFGYHSLSEVVGDNCEKFYISREEYERAGKICYPNGGSTVARMRKSDNSETSMLIRVQVSNNENGRALVVFCGLEGLKKICNTVNGHCLEGEC